MPMPMAASTSTSTSTSLSVVGTGLAFPRHPPAVFSSARFHTRLRSNNRFFLSSSLPSERRRHKAVCGGGLGLLRRNKSRGGHAFVVGEPSFLLPQHSCASCCCLARKRRSNLSTFVPGAFLDKSSFRLSNNKFNRSPVQIPRATVGPDEPHAASTTWPDGLAEKQDLTVYDSELEQIEGFLSSELPSHPKLHRGQLKNGLRYLILPNKVPPTRFEAHLEVHAGSIDEEEDEQGIAHMIEHVRRLKEFGVTQGELTRYLDALLKDSEHLAAMIDNVSSVDNLDFIMESDALGHKVMDQRQGHESLLAVAGTVTLEEVNSVGAKVLEFIAEFAKPTAPLPAAIVACVPKKVHIEGAGETEFKISSIEITDAIKAGLDEPIQPEPELEVPKELIQSTKLEELKKLRKPAFIPVNPETDATKLHDEETGISRRRLSNGIPVNYKISKTETQSGVMRLIVGGGRAAESPESRGSVIVGVRTLSEGGRVGNFSREQVELFCVNHLINCSLESTEEFISMEFRFTLRDNGMRAAFQLLHMVLEHSVWVDDAFDRARQLYLSYYRSIPKSLERSTAHKLMVAMLDGDERFIEPTPKSLENLTLQSVKDAVMNQFFGDNMEVCIVGDFTEEDIESCILDYLGTAQAARNHEREKEFNPPLFRPSPSDLQFQEVFLKDTDERACAYIAGPAPNRWGFTVDGVDLLESINNASTINDDQSKSNAQQTQGLQKSLCGHPLFFGITMGLLSEIINSRLFTSVRDSLGLTYDVSFELNLFDRLKLGWYVISVTSTPSKVHKAVDACKNVLRGLHSNKITERELDRAKRTLLMRHEAEIKSNAYWLGLLAHLQASSVPRKDISCIKDLTFLYEVATIEDIYRAYEQLKVDENSLYSCIGIAGAQAAQEIAAPLEEEVADDVYPGVIPVGRGLSTMTRPTT
ncbi:Stromal processing peptidase, chloroplastic [Glycine max]|nr:Stromal processing peptidase, chloroplastic [Glycine max]